MKKRYHLLALIEQNNPFQKRFFRTVKQTFTALFELDIKENTDSLTMDAYQAIVSFDEKEYPLPTLRFSQEESASAFVINQDLLEEAKTILSLSHYLTDFYQSLSADLMDFYPYQLRLADQRGHFFYHNHHFNGSFLPDDKDFVEDWILRLLKSSTEASYKHFLLPSASLDHIYVQSFYPLRDDQGHYLGSFDLVQDIKPILENYLEETAQAIVGWSDVTSGPSISNDF
ncbi:hypothetical protein [Streptococcus catagoni]|uniref:hypothetical protein n=1 Tax=Streptococcus catagoni TaxID=2654874 RepID=UPI00140DE901|nr:hypothetical protein [Streptococcus catagoni]